MHGTGHWLGMDVHDVGDYRVEGQIARARAGDGLHVEPGLYVDPDRETATFSSASQRGRDVGAAAAPGPGGRQRSSRRGEAKAATIVHPIQEFRGIGVRIEDDVLITADGAEVSPRASQDRGRDRARLRQSRPAALV